MKVSEKEAVRIHKFVCRQLHAEPDLSSSPAPRSLLASKNEIVTNSKLQNRSPQTNVSLTLGILKKRYLAHVGCESLSSETRNFMKQVVQEELMKMQENGHDLETKMPQNKRKREEENDEVISERESEDESRAKKSRRQLSSSSESEDKEDHKTGSEESEEEEQIKTASGDEEQEVKQSNSKQQINSENSSDDEKNESKKSESESSCTDSPKAKVKTTPNTTKNGAKTSSSTSPGKKTPQSDEEDEADSESESEKRDKNNVNDSSDDSEKEENVLVEKKTNGSDSDSDSSSLTSLEDEKGSGTGKEKNTEKKKTVEKKEGSKSQKNSDKTIARLKRYLSLCGVRRNYKKVLQDCRSARAMVAVLKKELENLGVQGNPSIKKCKDVKKKREQAQELAELDVSNIIATEGRPTRRGASVSKKQQNTPSSAYQRTLNSGSDSGEENTQKGHRRAIDWTNLKGIISDDADSA